MSGAGPSDPPSVSYVITVYNKAQYLPGVIDSLALQEGDFEREFIFIDDGSTDDSTEAVIKATRGWDNVRILSQENAGPAMTTNAGVAAARNAGAVRATADHIAFLDSDDVWSPDKLERQFALFDEDPKVVLVHCGVRVIDENDRPITGEVLTGSTGDVHRDLVLQRSVIFGGGSGAVFAKWAFDAVGGFDTRFSTSADWHLWLRITRLGPVAMVSEPLVNYRIHGSNMHMDVMAEARDMFLGLREAIAEDPIAAAVGNRALARLHRTMAGGFWNEKKRARSIRHALVAILREPSSIGWLAGHVIRRFPTGAGGADRRG